MHKTGQCIWGLSQFYEVARLDRGADGDLAPPPSVIDSAARQQISWVVSLWWSPLTFV